MKCLHPEEACRSRWHYIGSKLISASGFCGACGIDFILHKATGKLEPETSILIAEQKVEDAKEKFEWAKKNLRKLNP